MAMDDLERMDLTKKKGRKGKEKSDPHPHVYKRTWEKDSPASVGTRRSRRGNRANELRQFSENWLMGRKLCLI